MNGGCGGRTSSPPMHGLLRDGSPHLRDVVRLLSKRQSASASPRRPERGTPTLVSNGCISCRHLVPSIDVHAGREEPRGQRSLAEDAGRIHVGRECTRERRGEK